MDKRTIHLFLLFSLILGCNAVLFAQKNGNSLLADFPTMEAAKLTFDKNLKSGNDGEKVYANIGLAQLAMEDNKLEAAFQHADTAAKSFIELNEKWQERLAKKNWTLTTVRNFATNLITQAFEKTQEVNTLAAWDNFLTRFQKPNYASAALNKFYTEGVEKRNGFLCEDLKTEQDTAKLNQMLKIYERDLKRAAPDCYRSAATRQLQMAMWGKSWTELKSFFKNNPRHPLSMDASREAFLVAMNSNDFKQMYEFSKKNPESGFAQIARDTAAFYVFPELKKLGNFEQMMGYFLQYPNSSRTPDVDAFFADYVLKTDIVLPFRNDMNPKLSLKNLPKTSRVLQNFYNSYGSEWAVNQLVKYHNGLDIPQEKIQSAIELYRLAQDPETRLEFIKNAPTTYAAFRALQKIIKPDIEAKNWEKAARTVREHRPLFSEKAPLVDSLIMILERPLSNVTVENLGNKVNSPTRPDYCPVISTDNRTLYFCRHDGRQEDVFKTSRDANGNWTAAEVCQGLNTGANEAPITVSSDGNRLLFFQSGKLYFADKNTEGGWTEGKRMPQTINGSIWQAESSFSPDGKVLIFESRQRNNIVGMKESSANYDNTYHSENIELYVSFRKGEEDWSEAVNLGKTINTPYRERSPFLHPDGRTLYFCSEGHGGLGDMDLFKTTRLDSTWLNWSAPVHVGKELNTVNEDWGYKVSTNGKYAYFSSNEDLWMATPLPEAARPLPMRTITGIVRDFNDKPVIGSLIELRDKTTGKIVSTLKPDPKTGEYAVVVPEDANYEAVVRTPNTDFIPVTVNLETTASTSGDKEGSDNIRMIRQSDVTTAGVSFTLKELLFDFTKATIQPNSYAELDRWVEVLTKYGYKAVLEGHTDNKGNDDENQKLSEQRVNAARDYLISKGCNPANIEAKGFGEKMPIAPNETEAGRAKNRRVEIKIRKHEKQ